MLNAKQFGMLKKGNIGVDAKKVKQRIPETFKSANKEQRKEIMKLSGFSSPSSFGNVANTGAASPKSVLSLAQVLSISPYYLTGESDSKEPCNDVVLAEFFKKCNAGKPKVVKSAKTKAAPVKTKSAKAVAKKTESAKPKVKPDVIKENPVKPIKKVAPVKPVPVPVEKPVSGAVKPVNIDNDSVAKLLEALIIRAKYNDEAAATYAKVKELLVK